MDFTLKNKQAMQATDEQIEAQAQKLSYSSPVLQVYGSVGKLTQGAGGSHNGDAGLKKPTA